MKPKVVKSILKKIAKPVPTGQSVDNSTIDSALLLGHTMYNSPDFKQFVFSKTHRTPDQLDSTIQTKLFSEFLQGLNSPL